MSTKNDGPFAVDNITKAFGQSPFVVLRENDWMQRRWKPMDRDMSADEMPVGRYIHVSALEMFSRLVAEWRDDGARHRQIASCQQKRGDDASADVSFQCAQDCEAFADQLSTAITAARHGGEKA
jgi:hypothetical protein